MVINNTTKYDEIWNSVYSKLSFSPSYEYRGHSLNVALPFHINENYSVYAIEDMTDYQLDMLSDTMRSTMGASGGPLVDKYGEVIGMHMAGDGTYYYGHVTESFRKQIDDGYLSDITY